MWPPSPRPAVGTSPSIISARPRRRSTGAPSTSAGSAPDIASAWPDRRRPDRGGAPRVSSGRRLFRGHSREGDHHAPASAERERRKHRPQGRSAGSQPHDRLGQAELQGARHGPPRRPRDHQGQGLRAADHALVDDDGRLRQRASPLRPDEIRLRRAAGARARRVRRRAQRRSHRGQARSRRRRRRCQRARPHRRRRHRAGGGGAPHRRRGGTSRRHPDRAADHAVADAPAGRDRRRRRRGAEGGEPVQVDRGAGRPGERHQGRQDRVEGQRGSARGGARSRAEARRDRGNHTEGHRLRERRRRPRHRRRARRQDPHGCPRRGPADARPDRARPASRRSPAGHARGALTARTGSRGSRR